MGWIWVARSWVINYLFNAHWPVGLMPLQVESVYLQMTHLLSLSFSHSGGISTFVAFAFLIALLSFGLNIRVDSYGQKYSILTNTYRILTDIKTNYFLSRDFMYWFSQSVISYPISLQPKTTKKYQSLSCGERFVRHKEKRGSLWTKKTGSSTVMNCSKSTKTLPDTILKQGNTTPDSGALRR